MSDSFFSSQPHEGSGQQHHDSPLEQPPQTNRDPLEHSLAVNSVESADRGETIDREEKPRRDEFEPGTDAIEPTDDAEPQFGLVDVIEAFTAMRHESRSQTRETRRLSETLQQTVTKLAELEDKWLAEDAVSKQVASETSHPVDSSAASAESTRRLAEAVVEIDDHLTRAVEAASRAGAASGHASRSGGNLDSLHRSVQQAYDESGPVARWLARPFLHRVQAAIDRWFDDSADQEDPTTEGLKLLGARVRRLMRSHRIERIETVGEPFDGETMNAVDAVARQDVPSGQVVEQIRPAYRWQDRLIQYADVRVAR